MSHASLSLPRRTASTAGDSSGSVRDPLDPPATKKEEHSGAAALSFGPAIGMEVVVLNRDDDPD